MALPSINSTLKSLKLKLDPKSVTISGLSSGAFMAHQMMIIHSELFLGSGTFAGGPFNCSRGNSQRAQELCMTLPELVQSKDLITDIESFYNAGWINNPADLENKKIFIFHGTVDPTIAPVASTKIEEIYSHFKSQIQSVRNIPAGHGFPTVHTDQKCEATKTPWLNNCQYDGAGEMLKWFYGKLNAPMDSFSENIFTFDQLEFSNLSPALAQEGHIYVPKNCLAGNKFCKLHLALHGCLQNSQFVGNDFISKSGYNQWAESNNIVVVYPATQSTRSNPNGCWDWFGATDKKFNTKDGIQIKFLEKIITQLLE